MIENIKTAQTESPVLDVIKNRWSARSFSDREISDEAVRSIFEAARWAASANNEQPWHYLYAHKGTEGFDRLFDCLLPGNKLWAKDAALLIVASVSTVFESTQKENQVALHDLGLANAQMLLQAVSMGIYGHIIGGFDKQKAMQLLPLKEHVQPVCMFVLGYLGDPAQLEEPFRSRELTARKRKAIEEFAVKM